MRAEKESSNMRDQAQGMQETVNQAIIQKERIMNQGREVHDSMERMMDRAGLTPERLTSSSLTSDQCEQIRQIVLRVHYGISSMVETPSSTPAAPGG
jgi:hypothetical protein